MNDRRGDPTIQRLRGLEDIEPDLIQTGHARYFGDRTGERWTYEFQGIRQQIDHILVSDSLQRGLVVSNGIRARVQRVTDQEISDHSPLIVTLNFRN